MEAMPLEVKQRVENDAPDFIREVQQAKKHQLPGVDVSDVKIALEAFYDDAVLLYLCLWYANTEGVTVTITPS